MFHAALFCLWINRHKKLRSLGNNVLEAFKISRFYFFDLRSDLGGPEASELENREKKTNKMYQISVDLDLINFKWTVLIWFGTKTGPNLRDIYQVNSPEILWNPNVSVSRYQGSKPLQWDRRKSGRFEVSPMLRAPAATEGTPKRIQITCHGS